MTRWTPPPERELDRRVVQDPFDPLVEGARHGLTRELSLAIWERVRGDGAGDVEGHNDRDTDEARRRFHEVASRVASRGGRLRTDVGKLTRVGVELGGEGAGGPGADALAVGAPGRETLVAGEARRAAQASRKPAARGQAVSTSDGGRPLPDATRARLEDSFGVSLAAVRLHTGVRSDEAARALDALAFAHGHDIHFAAGQLRPDTPEGYRLLAHEVAHAVQAGGIGSLEVAPAGSAAEVEADAAARVVGRGHRFRVTASRGAALHAFQPHEHRDLGDQSGGGDVDITLDDGSKLTFGETIALADYIGSPDRIRELAKSQDGQLRIRWTLWFANVRGGTEPPYAGKVQARADWYKEVANNVDHFGQAAQDAYADHHGKALGLAYLAGFQDAKQGDANLEEAFASHYLNDLFAAGHIRTPRAEIKEWYAKEKPYSGRDIVEFMADTVADYMKEGHTLLKYADNMFRVVANKVEADIRKAAGAALDGFSLGDIVSGAYHDEDNEGLQVRSDCDPAGNELPGGFPWNAIGDHYLNDPKAEQQAASAMTRKMALAAMKASQDELAKARELGKKANTGPAMDPAALAAAKNAAVATLAPYKAKKFVPRVDPQAGVKERNWKWNGMDQEFKDAVDRYVKGRIYWQLVGAAGNVPEEVVVNESVLGSDTLRPRDAYKKFCEQVKQQGYYLIWQAIGF